MKLKIVISVAIFAAVIIAIVALQPGRGSDEITVGFIGPLTGDYAITGVENLRGIQIAVDEINARGGIDGRKVRIVAEDDQNLPARSVSAFQKFTAVDGVSHVFTVNYAGFLTLAPLADTQKIILLESLDTSKEIADAGDYAFGIGIYDEAIGYKLAEYAYGDIGGKKAGVIYNNNDAFMLLTKNSFRERFERLGGSVAVQEYSSETNDFRSHITKIDSEDTDFILVLGYDEAGFIMRQAKELGVDVPMLAVDTTLSEGFRKNAGGAYEGIIFTSWESDDKIAENRFVDAYRTKFGAEPQQILFTVTGYDAMNVLAESMADTTEQTKDRLYSVRDFRGIAGNLTMSPDGIVRSIEEKMYVIRGGVPVKIE